MQTVKKRSIENQSRPRRSSIKSIYLGKKSPNKQRATIRPKKVNKMEYYLLLFEAFVTGGCRLNSELNRRYYSEGKEELKQKIMREYPKINIEKQLNTIESLKAKALREFNETITLNSYDICNSEIISIVKAKKAAGK